MLCEKNTSGQASNGGQKDRFYKMSLLKLLGFHEYTRSGDANDCYTWCMNNYSCLAYAYVNGIGCLVWSEGLIGIQEFSSGEEDFFLRLAHKDLGENNSVFEQISIIKRCFLFINIHILMKNSLIIQSKNRKFRRLLSDSQLFLVVPFSLL